VTAFVGGLNYDGFFNKDNKTVATAVTDQDGKFELSSFVLGRYGRFSTIYYPG
jgi:hypothetical protein